jgi:membrane fusion protein (multidrug efflux system)
MKEEPNTLQKKYQSEEYDVARADFKSAQAQSQLIQAHRKTASEHYFQEKIGLRSISPGTYITINDFKGKSYQHWQLKLLSIPEKHAS